MRVKGSILLLPRLCGAFSFFLAAPPREGRVSASVPVHGEPPAAEFEGSPALPQPPAPSLAFLSFLLCVGRWLRSSRGSTSLVTAVNVNIRVCNR